MADGDREMLQDVVDGLRDAENGLGKWLREVSEAQAQKDWGLGDAMLLAYTAQGSLLAAVTLVEQAIAALPSEEPAE